MTVDKLICDPADMHTLRLYKLVSGTIVPRPIGFVSTQGPSGVPNVAPFSFFNAVSHRPPIVFFSSALRDGRDKDTIVNVRETGEFVVNIVSEEIAQQMSASADNYPPSTSEFEVSGLTAVPGSEYTVVLGEVLLFHVAREVIGEEGRIDSSQLKAIGRMAGNSYASTRELFSMEYNTFRHIK